MLVVVLVGVSQLWVVLVELVVAVTAMDQTEQQTLAVAAAV
jgi:hypothetical protein